MNSVKEDEFNLTENLRDIERRFCRFYLKTIKDYYDLDENFVWTAKDVSNLQKKKKKHHVINKAYELLLLCIQDTCLGLRKFHSSLMKYKEIPEYLSKKNPLVMYCVVGESFFAALGICIVIDEAIEKYGLSDKKDSKQIQLIVTDKYLKWKDLSFYIVERVNSYYKNIEVKLDFLEEKSIYLSGEVYRKLEKADIVVLSRYFSRFQCLTEKSYLLEFILKRMKELSILFYLDTCQKKYKDTVKHVLTEAYSLIEIRSKKTAFESLEHPENGEYFSEFPFLYNTTFEDVTYSVSIKFFPIYNASADNYTKFDIALLRKSRKQIKRKISERFAKESSLLSESKTEADSVINGNPGIRNQENRNLKSKVKTTKAKILQNEKVVRKSATANVQNKNKYECPHLKTKKSVAYYAYSLSEIYYSKHFDKEIPCSPKMKLYKQVKK